jgi:uncharacterized membrane protein
MEQQETILDAYKKYFSFTLNVIWGVILVLTILSVISLLYVNDFKGMAIILFKLIQFFAIVTVIGLFVWFYIWLILKASNRAKLNRLEREKQRWLILRQIIKEEIKNGRTTTKRR